MPLNIPDKDNDSFSAKDAERSDTKIQQPRPPNADHKAVAMPGFPLSEFAHFYPGSISVVKAREHFLVTRRSI